MKYQIPLIAVLYVLIHQGATTYKVTYEGVNEATAGELLKDRQKGHPGATFSFVSKDVFNATPDPLSPIISRDAALAKAVADAKDKRKTTDERIDALIQAIDLR